MPRHLLWEASCACQWGPSMGPVSASWELPAGAMYGRPVISNLEMDAVDTGGAELVA